MARFDGKVGFVTGGATGIGFACARAIAEAGGHTIRQGPDLVPFFQRFAAPDRSELDHE